MEEKEEVLVDIPNTFKGEKSYVEPLQGLFVLKKEREKKGNFVRCERFFCVLLEHVFEIILMISRRK